jgi:hypothetical protein
LTALPWLLHGFSTRVGGFSRAYGEGDLNLGFTKDDAHATIERNREAFLSDLGAVRGAVDPCGDGRLKPALSKRTAPKGPSGRFLPKPRAKSRGQLDGPASAFWPLITLRQIHSDIIHCVDSIPAGPLVGDGLLTAIPGLLLAVQTADCLPVIVVDTKRCAVGVFHAGWRSTVKRLVEKGVGEMFRHFGSRPRYLKAAIGPGIQACCYEVGEEVRTKFESQFAYAASLFREVKESDLVREKYPLLFLNARAPGHGILPNKIFLDLVEANRRQLLAAGVAAKNIEASPLCTSCHPELLFSHRAGKGKTGRMMGVAVVRG